MPGFLTRLTGRMVHHLDNTEAAVGVPRLITDRHAEDPDVSPGGPADQEVQRSSLVVSDGPLVSLLAGGEGHHQRSGLDQQDGGHGLAVFCHPRQPLDCQTSREISHFPTVGPSPRSHGESGLPTGGTSPVSCAQLSVPGRHLIDLLHCYSRLNTILKQQYLPGKSGWASLFLSPCPAQCGPVGVSVSSVQ